ncbi:MAG: ABC transporter permease [Saprospiraceae bacterium]|jgi:ABC-2 type transport system permease protein|uniref:ABC transporter permease n=1 Tax=Candidatus Brachybacter algidus TaxID=2982024 RepID=UPI001B593BD2|nr:ABC transporter permease [Candidatus Brachybacter algidus]MBP7306150.1 ABC transporter permease [Saprospiraceae bacterium]MBK6372990.1 ABC transporter permease [Candidatus Brachybacter algidus]MBK6447646.1 ABC transporter permease [Candidatus Brachybacter algidus]MBK7602451.1 ABC transporter permease [Candidatus Brachybacter algidus]MBK8354880.1 ABC transporter permease [Candidatus Brachybacter algidus]
MNNTFIVAKREFVTRAFKKKFLLITLFMPLIIAIFSGSIGYIMSYKNDTSLKVMLVDPNNLIPPKTNRWENITFQRTDLPIDQLKKDLAKSNMTILSLPALDLKDTREYKANYFSSEKVDLETKESLRNFVKTNVKNKKLANLGLDVGSLSKLDQDVSIAEQNISGKKDTGSEVAAALGGIFGFFLYLLLTINGSMIMRSVMEEKTSRIVEVMISTVKPHELMFGKILGVGLVGLFQIIIWCVTTPLFIWLISSVFMSGASMTMPQGPGAAAMNPDMANNVMAGIFSQLSAINWWMLIPLLFLFFLLGYLMYSSLFAAIGSTMGDDQGEGQSLTFLVIMPLLFGFYISISAIKAPNSSLAVWSSQIPFFSPIVMPVRLAFDPPGWQIATSLFILSLSALFFAWLSSRIYRVGILMYGKKASFSDLRKWFNAK